MSDPLSKRRRYRPVKPVRMVCHCAVAGCAGLVEFTGEAISTAFQTAYKHKCSMCAIEEWANEQFPRIEYHDV